MAGLTKTIPRFVLAGATSKGGLPLFLQRLIGGWATKGAGIMGTTTITSGNTTVVVTDTGVTATDVFIVSIQGLPTNACYFTGVSAIVAGTSYTLNVNTNPGTGGVVLFVMRLPGALLFSS
jgi:hypothetical protein